MTTLLLEQIVVETTEVGRARALVRDAVSPHLGPGSEPNLVSDLVLATSELVTNAIVHGTGPVTLRLDLVDGVLRLTVKNRGPLHPSLQKVDLDAAGGRGLGIVATVASEWGWDAIGNEVCVWCELPLGASTVR